MSTVIDSLERAQLRRVPTFDAGDRLRVHFQVIEGTRRRTQVFEGVVIRRQGHGARETFTVRKQSFGVGVERTFPLHSPKIERIEVAARGDVRRAKLYYLRGRVGKRARVRERRTTGPERVVERELLYPTVPDAATAQADVDEAPPEAQDESETVAEQQAAAPAEATEPEAAQGDGDVPETPAAVAEPDAPVAVAEPDAPVAEPDAAVAKPDAPVADADPLVAEPDAATAEPDSDTAEPASEAAAPARESDGPAATADADEAAGEAPTRERE